MKLKEVISLVQMEYLMLDNLWLTPFCEWGAH